MHTKIERTKSGQWNILVNGLVVEGGFFSRARAREAAAKLRDMMDTERDEIKIAGGPDHDTRDREGYDHGTRETAAEARLTAYDDKDDSIEAKPASIVASATVAKAHIIKTLDGYLFRQQPRKPGETAAYKVVPFEKASRYVRLEQAQLKVEEAKTLGLTAWVEAL